MLSRSEYDVDGPVEAKVVEEVFVRAGLVLTLAVGGRVIHTTPEHPFYVLGKGWRCAKELQAGEWFVSHEGMPVVLEQVSETAELATVYNLRVADYHTYFVGCQEWGFSVWAHNADYIAREIPPSTPGYDAKKPFGIWDNKTRRFTGEAFESCVVADTRAADLSKLAEEARAAVPAPKQGQVRVEQAALDQAAKSSAEQGKLRKLQETGGNLANGGFDVRVLGEATDQVGDLAVKGPGLASELPAQSKRLDSATKNAVQGNIEKGIDQVAKSGQPGVVVIDGRAKGLTEEVFNEGLGAFLRSPSGTGKSGTVIVVLGDGTVQVRPFKN